MHSCKNFIWPTCLYTSNYSLTDKHSFLQHLKIKSWCCSVVVDIVCININRKVCGQVRWPQLKFFFACGQIKCCPCVQLDVLQLRHWPQSKICTETKRNWQMDRWWGRMWKENCVKTKKKSKEGEVDIKIEKPQQHIFPWTTFVRPHSLDSEFIHLNLTSAPYFLPQELR